MKAGLSMGTKECESGARSALAADILYTGISLLQKICTVTLTGAALPPGRSAGKSSG